MPRKWTRNYVYVYAFATDAVASYDEGECALVYVTTRIRARIRARMCTWRCTCSHGYQCAFAATAAQSLSAYTPECIYALSAYTACMRAAGVLVLGNFQLLQVCGGLRRSWRQSSVLKDPKNDNSSIITNAIAPQNRCWLKRLDPLHDIGLGRGSRNLKDPRWLYLKCDLSGACDGTAQCHCSMHRARIVCGAV